MTSVLAQYDYTDNDGKLIARSMKIKENLNFYFYKEFYDNSMGNIVLNLPAVTVSIAESENIYLVENEKTAEMLNRFGVVATCFLKPPTKEQAEFFLKGAKIILLGNNDVAGRDFKWFYGNLLTNVAKSLITINIRIDLLEMFISTFLEDKFVEYLEFLNEKI